MSISYRAVGWNRQKKRYDVTVLAGVGGLLTILIGGGAITNPNATIETLFNRALGISAFILLHAVMSIGPFRRHMGVTMFDLALAHGTFALVQFHALGNRNPFVSVLATSTDYLEVSGFPFQVLGLAALGILFLMAATSHDFWLHNLTAPVWKMLHMGVYVAYGLIVAHVALGALQSERSPWLATLLSGGVVWVIGLHIAAAFCEPGRDVDAQPNKDMFVDVCGVDEIPDRRAVVRCVGGERVAV